MKPLILFAAFLLCALRAGAADAPNVIVIMTDDQGWGDLSLHGNETVATPHIDRLAMEGLQFRHFYLQPVCSPTRAEFLTGRYHPRSGVFNTGGGGERMDIDEETIADVFKGAGYRTGLFGKWHSGSQYPYHPLGRGFDEFYGFTSGHWGLYFSPMVEHNGAITRGNGYLPNDYTDKALGFIERQVERKEPFFVYLAYNIPHSPMQVPDRFWEKYEHIELKQSGTNARKEIPLHTRAALAMCENIDWNVGRLMASLRELEVDEETIVVFLSDNGPNGDRWNGGMKGRKGSTDEGGVRTPLFLRWPGTVGAGKVVPQIGSVIDLLPTLADLVGIEHPPKAPLDGISLKPVILGDPPDWPDRRIFASWKGRVSVRSQRFRFDHQGRLYDIQNDPNQLIDVSDRHPQIAEELKSHVAAWRREMFGDKHADVEGVEAAARPFLVGHADFSVTFLPARDAETTGSIERSNRWPNDSYFKHWTTESDRIRWNVEVLESGLYAAEIWYACPQEDVGSTLELSFRDASTSVVVHEAHDPPLLGVRHTRSPLYESPVKIFRRLGMGAIRLEAGQGPMILRASDIPNGQAIEFRLLTLTRIR